jgi:1-deoxy-D-xylulose-5-phosphate synthase
MAMAEDTRDILSGINSPEDLKKLNENELIQLAEELRQFIIDAVCKNPGHVGANLGAIEITLALHYVFKAPEDKIVWDVGHQAYAHKIITGRRDRFHTNRTYNGLSGFPSRDESPYDAFGTGHSSTSLSATLGMALAAAQQGKTHQQHIAVIGDGSMSGGMAMEALNNIGAHKSNMLIILNDNGIAIDHNFGALKEYLARITASKFYNRLKDFIWKIMGGNTRYGKNSRALIRQLGNAVKSSLLDRSNLFEAFNIRYFGPVDGHDVNSLIKILKDLKDIPGPKLLHCVTKKGKGFEKAEKDQVTFHSPGRFDKNTGEAIKAETEPVKKLKYQDVFGKTMVDLATKNNRIVAVTPAMLTGSSLTEMMAKYPERTFDVGIAEQHAVTFSAGLAAEGAIPYCTIYSTFLQRAYDQVIHDVAIQKLPVILCIDRGGLVGEDGATHHGAYDLAFLRLVPNIIVSAPLHENELRNLLYTAQLENHGTFAIRFPRGKGVNGHLDSTYSAIPIGKGEQLRSGKDIAILAIGHPGNDALKAAQELAASNQTDVAVYNMRFLKPIDEALLHDVFNKYHKIITIEDGTVIGGLGSAIAEFKNQHRYQATVEIMGIPDRFIQQGSQAELKHECGFDVEGIRKKILELHHQIK